MGSGTSRACSSVGVGDAYAAVTGATMVDEKTNGYEVPWSKASSGQYKKLLEIPRGNVGGDEDAEVAPLEVGVQQLAFSGLQRPNASVVTLAFEAKGTYYDAPDYTSFGSLARAKNIDLFAGKPLKSEKFSESPPLLRLDYQKPEFFHSLWLMELSHPPISTRKAVEAFATLRQHAPDLVNASEDAEILIPLIGYNEAEDVVFRSVLQEAIAFAFQCSVSAKASLKRVVFMVPSAKVFQTVVDGVNTEQRSLRVIETMPVFMGLGEPNLEPLIRKISSWEETFNSSVTTLGNLRGHLDVIIKTHGELKKKHIGDTVHQLAFVVCDSGRHVSEAFVKQWQDIPGFQNITDMDMRLRLLRYTPVAVIKNRGTPVFNRRRQNSEDSRSRSNTELVKPKKDRFYLTQKQYEALQILQRLGTKARTPEQAAVLNSADVTFALQSIIYILGSISAPMTSTSLTGTASLNPSN